MESILTVLPTPAAFAPRAVSILVRFVVCAIVAVQPLQSLGNDNLSDISREQVLEAIVSEDADIRSGAYIALGEVGSSEDLPLLYSALYDNDHLIRHLAEASIWKIWGRSGNSLHDRMFQRGVEQMHAGRFVGAIQSFSALINLAPDFTEAWNKRATAYYLVGEDEHSIADCEQVLAREPNHFGALSGYGLLMLRKRDYKRALEYFERALTVNPNLRGVPENIENLKRLLAGGEGDDV